MVVRISDKKKNYSKVTKLLVKPLAFQKKVKGVQESILKDNAQAKPIYDHIQKVNKKYEGKDGE